MAKMTPRELTDGMAQATGTEGYTRHGLMRNLLMTDGTMFVIKGAEAFWLADAIASHMSTSARLQREEFQTWTFIKNGDDQATRGKPHTLSVSDGNNSPPIVTQKIEYSDFPLPSIVFWAVKDHGLGGWVLMLPSEY